MAFDNPTRNRLASFVAACRNLLSDEFTDQLKRDYGLDPDSGVVTDIDKLTQLDDAHLETARILRDTLQHYVAGATAEPKKARQEAMKRIVREQAFTVLNRLCALRMAEARKLFVESVGNGLQSQGFQLYARLAGTALGESGDAYRCYLFSVFDELAVDLAVLFNRFSPEGRLFPPESVLLEILGKLNAPDMVALWAEDETIGWIYQYFNDPAERKKMRDESSAPRNSRELAVRNQFFTPRYVVEFLTDNTLGRIWYEMTQGQTSLKDTCRYMVRRPDEVFLSSESTEPLDPVRWGFLPIEAPGSKGIAARASTSATTRSPAKRASRAAAKTKAKDETGENTHPTSVAELLLSGREEAFPEFSAATDDQIQRMIEFAHCVDGYVRHPNEEGSWEWLQKLQQQHLERMQYEGVLTQDVLDALFLTCRADRHGGDGTVYKEPWFVAACNEVRRRVINSRRTDLSQEELLKQPVFIPYRALKDPREIRMLDPACGSMHFGLYAFDLFETIYEEGLQQETLQRNLAEPYGFGGPGESRAVPNSVQLLPEARIRCFSSGREIDVKDAVLVLDRYGEGIAGRPLIYHADMIAGREDRLSMVLPLADFDYATAIREGWFAPTTGLVFLEMAGCFTFERRPALSLDEAACFYRRDIPRFIIECNIHGIDIDRRATQIAGLSLWLRAQKSWQKQKVKPQDRPRIVRSNIVCAEPMPGNSELLEEFLQKHLSSDAEGQLLTVLVRKVFEAMKLAGEAGSLLKIEEEIAGEVEKARLLWEKSREKKQQSLFDNRPKQVQQELDFVRRIDDATFWDEAENLIYAALRAYAEQAEIGGGFQRRLFAEDAARGFAFIDVCRKRYDVALMNPPFGLGLKATEKYLQSSYIGSGGEEVASSFYSRILEMLSPMGRVGEISSRTCFYLSTLAEWREAILFGKSCLEVYVDLGEGILDGAVNETAAYVAQNRRDKDGHCAFGMFHRVDDIEKELSGLACLAVRSEIIIRPLTDLEVLSDRPLCYWVSNDFVGTLHQLRPFGEFAAAVQMGLAPRDEFRFSRLWWEVQPECVGRQRMWIGYAKGGELSPYYSDIELLLNAAGDLTEIKAALNQKYPYLNGNLNWVLHPENDYFVPGLTFGQRTTFLRTSVLPQGCYFSVAGKGIFGRSQSTKSLLQSINTPSAQFLIYLRRERLSLDPQFQEGDVARMPWPDIDNEVMKRFEEWAMENVALVRSVASYDEIDHAFNLVSFGGAAHRTATRAADVLFRNEVAANDLLSQLLNLSSADHEFINREIMPRWHSRSVANWFKSQEMLDAISFWLGSTLGRWDLRCATDANAQQELPDPFSPLPICPPGQLQNAEGLPARQGDLPTDYQIQIPWDGILVDDPGNALDIERRVREVIEIIWGDESRQKEEGSRQRAEGSEEKAVAETAYCPLPTAYSAPATPEAIEQEACEILGVRSLREYFQKPAKFFADHLKRYSKSRRQAPIYWPLSTESGGYTLWIYYHRLTDQTLFHAVNNFVEPRLKQVTEELSRLKAKSSRSSAEEKELSKLTELASELTDFRDELLRVAKFWKPSLNDGVLITASPLWKLFRLPKWRKDLKACWDELKKGDYDWAHLALSIWPDRVVRSALKDRSIAIAHNLDTDLWHEVTVTKTGKGKNPRTTTKVEWQPKKLSETELDKIVQQVKQRPYSAS